MAMNTVFLHLSEEAIKRLNKLRGWRKVSRSAILREAVEQYLERQQFPVRKAKGGRQKGEKMCIRDRYNEAKSSQSAIMVDTKGERIIINYPSPDLLPDAEWLEEIDFSQWDVVLADVRWHEGAKKAFTLARQAGVMTVLDGDITPQDISCLLYTSRCV